MEAQTATTTVWNVAEWCPPAKISVAGFYNIDPKDWPFHCYYGRALKIIESPADYYKRMARKGGKIRTVRAGR